MNKKLILIISFILAFDIILLVLLGKNYTKQLIVPPFLYLHDLVLFLLVGLSLPYFKYTQRIKSIEVLFVIAILFVMYSFLKLGFQDAYIILRQFMLFGYGICIYIIINRIFHIDFIRKNIISYVFYFGISCFIIQVGYVLYLLLWGDQNPFFERRYFSPLVVFGFFVLSSYVLIYIKNQYLKYLFFIIIFIVALSTGHDSTYLALALICFSYVFLQCNLKNKMFMITGLILLAVGVFVFVPSFSDVNMQWRLLFWKDSLTRIMNNYFVLGEGFGIQYASDDTIIQLNSLFPNSTGTPLILGDNKYLSAPHNSFITIMLHLGILSILLMFYPFKSLFKNNILIMDKDILFLSLSLLGFVVFSSFNVILELPHASSIFWIVFFVLIFKLSEKGGLPTNEQ